MSWWLRRVVDFLNWLSCARPPWLRQAGQGVWRRLDAARQSVPARISERKYDLLARRVGWDQASTSVPTPEPQEGQRRFILVQIDGLAHEYLLQALAMGQLPTVKRLLAEGYRLQRWRCGLPSTTPAVQAGMMYGNNWDIPAFRWYEKADGFAPMCRVPAHVARLKSRVAAGRQGILSGGCSYMNMWDGDARLALFTLSAMGRQRFFEHLRGLGWLLLFALIPWRLLRIIGLTAWELTRDWGRMLALWLRSGFRRRLTLVKPVLETLTNVVMGEIQTFGVLLDVYRGMPAICVNFYGYDEVAHGDGPLGSEALRALRRIDRRIREIDRIRRMYWPDMELHILSDHGMTPAVSFGKLDGRSLGAFVAERVQASTYWDEPKSGANAAPASADSRPDARLWLLDELDGIEPHLSRHGRRLLQALRRWIQERTPPDLALGWDLSRGSDVVVRSSGSLAHIYFNVTRERMNVSEVAILYAELVDALNDHPGIGLLLGTEDGRPVIITSHGTAQLTAEQLPHGLPESEQAAAELVRLLSFPHSGDLVLLGAWDGRGRVVAFEDQAATHGGIGGPQGYPFYIAPPSVPFDLRDVTNSEQLYPFFRTRYQSYAPASARCPD